MTELESLIQQKKDLEEKIKLLKGSAIKVGAASIRPDPNFSGRWLLAIDKKYFGDRSTYKSKVVRIGIADSRNREDVINTIPEFIKDLTELYKEAKK
jgi:hypothetical protein